MGWNRRDLPDARGDIEWPDRLRVAYGAAQAAVQVINTDLARRLFECFPVIARLDVGATSAVLEASREVTLLPGAAVFEPGQNCERYLLVRDGSVRVHLLDEDGREIVLYRLGRGDTCILTTAALLGCTPYPAYATTEARTEVTTLSAEVFEGLLAHDASFRRFVFASHAERIADLMRLVSDIAFTRIQVRLARCLVRQADPAGQVRLTHDAISVEIGTAREVVSRNLKLFERQGLVRLGLGLLSVLDGDRLARLAAGQDQPPHPRLVLSTPI